MKKFQEGVVSTPNTHRVFLNDKYQVDVQYLNPKRGMDGWLWIQIKARNKACIRDWRIFQKIKNMIAGDEREAVELYPAESRLVDTSNQFHLFVLPKGESFPYGYMDRMIVRGHLPEDGMGSRQREFQPNEVPDDAMTIQESIEVVTKNPIARISVPKQ